MVEQVMGVERVGGTDDPDEVNEPAASEHPPSGEKHGSATGGHAPDSSDAELGRHVAERNGGNGQ
jgi:hypothetical protein